ncbi:unnamed protein product [Sphacelaria rigidula]
MCCNAAVQLHCIIAALSAVTRNFSRFCETGHFLYLKTIKMPTLPTQRCLPPENLAHGVTLEKIRRSLREDSGALPRPFLHPVLRLAPLTMSPQLPIVSCFSEICMCFL